MYHALTQLFGDKKLGVRSDALIEVHESCSHRNGAHVLTPGAARATVTVLLIDDSQSIRRSAASMLAGTDVLLITAADGFAALAKLAEHKPDVVLADTLMPRLDGYQTCTLIKNSTQHSAVPVVMLCGRDAALDPQRAAMAGSDDYLLKPFNAESLMNVVIEYAQT